MLPLRLIYCLFSHTNLGRDGDYWNRSGARLLEEFKEWDFFMFGRPVRSYRQIDFA